MMDPTLRQALVYGALPAAVVLVGGGASLLKSLSPGLVSGVRKFAAGALFSIISMEMMPDLLFAHHFEAVTAFAAGVALMVAFKWLTGRLGRAGGERARQPGAVALEAVAYLLIAGLVIGGGFVAGPREGLLLTAAMTAEGLAVGLLTATRLVGAGVGRGTVVAALAALSALIVAGAVVGATLLWGRTRFDVDILLAFGMAALLLLALEAFVESREEESGLQTLLCFFGGLLLFLFLAGQLGGKHVEHPGRRGGVPPTPETHRF